MSQKSMAGNADGCGGRSRASSAPGRVCCAQSPKVSLAKAEMRQVRRNRRGGGWGEGGTRERDKSPQHGEQWTPTHLSGPEIAPFVLCLSVDRLPPPLPT